MSPRHREWEAKQERREQRSVSVSVISYGITYSKCFFTKNLGSKTPSNPPVLQKVDLKEFSLFLFETFTIFLGSAVVSKQNKTKLRFTAKRRKLKTERAERAQEGEALHFREKRERERERGLAR